MSSSHPNQPGFGQQQGQNYPNSSAGQWNHNGQAPQPIPPFAPEGTFLTPQGPVRTKAIKYRTIANRGLSTTAIILAVMGVLGSFFLIATEGFYYGFTALVSAVMLCIGAGVVHMMERSVAELRRLG